MFRAPIASQRQAAPGFSGFLPRGGAVWRRSRAAPAARAGVPAGARVAWPASYDSRCRLWLQFTLTCGHSPLLRFSMPSSFFRWRRFFPPTTLIGHRCDSRLSPSTQNQAVPDLFYRSSLRLQFRTFLVRSSSPYCLTISRNLPMFTCCCSINDATR